jgi:hypothetical protein
VLVRADDVFTAPVLHAVGRLTTALGRLDGVSRVRSLTSLRRLKGRGDELDTGPLVPDPMSGKKERFMGSDLAYEDLRPENLSLHRYTMLGSEAVDGHDCFLVEAVPASERQAADSGYSRRRLWIRKDIYVTVRQEYTDTRGRLEKIGEVRELAHVRGTLWRPNRLEMRAVQAGTRTVVRTEGRRLDQGLKESFVTQAELIRGRP